MNGRDRVLKAMDFQPVIGHPTTSTGGSQNARDRREFQMDPLIQEAKNRDVSQLTLISEGSYIRGLEAMRSRCGNRVK